MSVVPKPHEWDTIPDMAGTLVYERERTGWQVVVLSLFFVP
jgi:hypothetical protein